MVGDIENRRSILNFDSLIFLNDHQNVSVDTSIVEGAQTIANLYGKNLMCEEATLNLPPKDP